TMGSLGTRRLRRGGRLCRRCALPQRGGTPPPRQSIRATKREQWRAPYSRQPRYRQRGGQKRGGYQKKRFLFLYTIFISALVPFDVIRYRVRFLDITAGESHDPLARHILFCGGPT